jgi:fructose-1,6-bisphosphatase II
VTMTCHGPELGLELVRVTEFAALAACRWVGQGDVDGGVEAATDAARTLLGSLRMRGTVVVGESRHGRFGAGEQVGDGTGPVCDVEIAPFHGTPSAARGGPGALAVIAASVGGRMFRASPIDDMDVLVVGPEARDAVDADRPLAENVRAVAAAMRRPVSDVTVAVQGYREQATIVREVRELGARLRFVTGAEVTAALCAASPEHEIDLLVGISGVHGGLLMAAAVACLDGSIQARLRPREADGHRDAPAGGHDDGHGILHARDLVGGEDVVFSATGVTGDEEVPGVRRHGGYATTHSVVMSSSTGTVQIVEGVHRTGRLHDLLGV